MGTLRCTTQMCAPLPGRTCHSSFLVHALHSEPSPSLIPRHLQEEGPRDTRVEAQGAPLGTWGGQVSPQHPPRQEQNSMDWQSPWWETRNWPQGCSGRSCSPGGEWPRWWVGQGFASHSLSLPFNPSTSVTKPAIWSVFTVPPLVLHCRILSMGMMVFPLSISLTPFSKSENLGPHYLPVWNQSSNTALAARLHTPSDVKPHFTTVSQYDPLPHWGNCSLIMVAFNDFRLMHEWMNVSYPQPLV